MVTVLEKLSPARVLDAHTWIQSLGLDYYHVAAIRKLRLHDTFLVSCFAGPGVCNSPDVGRCVAEITKTRGVGNYEFSAVWTMDLSKKVHSHIFSHGRFKLLTGNLVEFQEDEDVSSEKNFRKVCRYASFVNRHSKDYGVSSIFVAGPSGMKHHSLWRGETIEQETGTNVYGDAPDMETLQGVQRIVGTKHK